MRSLHAAFLPAALSLLSCLLFAPGVRADQFETFHLDPSRSYLSFLSGEISADLSSTDYAYAALLSQAGADPAPLSGSFAMQIGNDATSPTFFNVISGSSDIRPADLNLVSPGAGGVPGLVDAAIGLSFADPTAGISGTLAAHDLVFGIDGSFSPYANALGPYGLQGAMGWALVSGVLEIETDIGLHGTAFTPFTTATSGFVERTASQFSEIAPGVYEVTMPYGFTLNLGPTVGPLTNTLATLHFGGEIVATNAVPEPGSGAMLASALVLLVVRSRKGDVR